MSGCDGVQRSSPPQGAILWRGEALFMLRFVPVSVLILAGALSVAQADVFRWVDEHGEPHYSDQWVPGSQIIKTSKAHPGSETLGQPVAAENRHRFERQGGRAAGQRGQFTRRAAGRQPRARRTVQGRHRSLHEGDRIAPRLQGKQGGRQGIPLGADADAYREVARKDVLDRCGKVPTFDPNAPIPEPKPIPDPKVNPADATSE